MATPMTSAQVVAQLKEWGLHYVEIPGWATHNRNSKGAWGGVNGFIWHHTGVDVKDGRAYAGSTLYNGLSDLPGPLCHFSIGTDGTVYLVGWGRANHAGGGDPAVLQHVINEDYTGQLKPTRGNSNGVDGNAHFYGVEIQYSGSHKMTDAQYKAALKLSAAILDFHGWSEKSVIAHGEWSSDKWDPGYAPNKIMAMPAVRADVAATLAAGPGIKTAPPQTPTKDDMPTAKEIADAVWQRPIENQFRKDSAGKPRKVAAQDYLEYGDAHYDELSAKLDTVINLLNRLIASNVQS
ncbi:peptidoglycan recognition family protein [Streptomyces antimycoticus]|uniref:peptidoglycan recognition protein family protein n=1 Tax=Streptomyces TaxID=1883 RepID=UPI0033F31CD7